MSKLDNGQFCKEIPILSQESKTQVLLETNNDSKKVDLATPNDKQSLAGESCSPKKLQPKNAKNKVNPKFKTNYESQMQKHQDDLSYFYSQQKNFYDYLNLNLALNEQSPLIDKCEKCLKPKKTKSIFQSNQSKSNSSCSNRIRNRNASSSIANELLRLSDRHRHQHHHHHHDHQHSHHQHRHNHKHNNHTRSYNEFKHESDVEDLDDYNELELNILGKRMKNKKFSSSPLCHDESLNSTKTKCISTCQSQSVNILNDANSSENIDISLQQQRQATNQKELNIQHHQSDRKNSNINEQIEEKSSIFISSSSL